MPLAPSELDWLLALIPADQEGLGIEAIARQLPGPLPRRTLQRRLALLVAQGRITRRGEARAARYVRLLPADGLLSVREEPAGARRPPAEVYVATSQEGAEIKAHVRQARALRKPVGYQLDFLAQYRPNRSAYLPPGLREQLHAIGRSPAAQAPAGIFAQDIFKRLLIDLSWASSRLEGNTYSRLDTERLIELGQAAEGKDALETQMILNHKQAIEYLVIGSAQAPVTPELVTALHALLSDGLMADPDAVGRLRSRPVAIGGSVYVPLSLPQQLQELFCIVIQTAAEVRDPFEQAFFLMVHLPYLQPFEDVNKRVSRLAANVPLMRANLCPLSFIDVPPQAYVDAMIGVYELNRVELLRDVFVWAYERSCQQYVAVQRDLVPPDLFRLRHRQALGETIAALVRDGVAATAAQVKARVPRTVAAPDRAAFIRLVLTEFESLHPGNAIRFGLRPLEFSDWQERHPRSRRARPAAGRKT